MIKKAKCNWAMQDHHTEWGIGDVVTVDDDSVHCRVTAINIRDRGIQYEVSWFARGESHVAWVEGWRLSEVALADPTRVGFTIDGSEA